MLLVTLGTSLLGSLLTGKCTIRAVQGQLQLLKAQLVLVRFFNAATSFN